MLTLAAALATAAIASAGLSQTSPGEPASALVERGRYLTVLGDCAVCHTRPGGRAFAGGLPIHTSFGVIYTTNITPDRTSGIGGWSQDAFWRAMHNGRRADGAHLYPAFPYPYFTHVGRGDSDAIWAYLSTVEPVDYRPPPNKLPFPVNIRGVMALWNWLFFRPGEFRPAPDRSAEWNRGAYVVTGLGHCGACHTPKNFLAADKPRQALHGGVIDNWFAADLSGDARAGLFSWSQADIVEFIGTGRNAHSGASASMADVVVNSTSQMTDADAQAIAVYLKSRPAMGPEPEPRVSPAVMRTGEAIYVDQCSACHGADGVGAARFFSPLKANANVQSRDPTTVARYLLTGTPTVATAARPTPLSMPAFAWKLNDEQIAAVASYIRNSWGNAAPAVTAGQVAKLRRKVAEHPVRPPPGRV
jgi:mono/diheme cytochrome c family protein